ncbi:MAG: GFA family protein [Patescibacteria group bacterium]
MAKHTGGCHCGAVRYEFEGEIAEVMECNCSHCAKKGMLLYFVDKDKFKLLSGQEVLKEYQFNKKQTRHYFCTVCGTQAHAEGVTFPKACVNVRCVDDIDLAAIPRKPFNGKDM